MNNNNNNNMMMWSDEEQQQHDGGGDDDDDNDDDDDDDDDVDLAAVTPTAATASGLSVVLLEERQEDLLLRHRRRRHPKNHQHPTTGPTPASQDGGEDSHAVGLHRHDDDHDDDDGNSWFGGGGFFGYFSSSSFRRYCWPASAPTASSSSSFWKRQYDAYWEGNGMQNYTLATLRKDCLAGLTVAVMAVPLSMSYAKLAGLPAYFGIYATFVPPLVYPVFGTSRQLVVGAAALVSLVVNTGVTAVLAGEGWTTDDVDDNNNNNDAYMARYEALAIQCSFLAGLIFLGMGIFRLGFVTQFLSRAVISGFTSGAAIVIAMSQIKHLLGITIPSSNQIQKLIQSLVQNIDQFNWRTFVMGSACFITLMGFKYASNRYPTYSSIKALGPFLVSAVSIALMFTVLDEDDDDNNNNNNNIPVVGTIPKGLPAVTINQWTPVNSKLLTTVLSIVIVGFVQSFALSKQIAYKHGYEISSARELVGLGMANIVGGMFQSYPATAGMGQSAVNDGVGAQTGVASMVTGVVVMFVLLFLTPVFEKLPLTVLAAIVISYVIGMVDYPEAMYLYRVHKFDLSVWLAAFLGTMFLGVEIGLAIAVGVSLLLVVYESVYPRTVVLGRLPGTSLYRNIKQYPDAEQYNGLLIVRIDGPLFFANALTVRDKVRKYKRVAAKELEDNNDEDDTDTAIKYLILDLSPVSHIDTTALHVLEDMYITQSKLGVQILLCNPSISVMKRLVASGIVELVGRRNIFPADIEAVNWCLNEIDKRKEEEGRAVEASIHRQEASQET